MFPIWLSKKELIDWILFNEQSLRSIFNGFKGTNDNDIDNSSMDLWNNYCTINKRYVNDIIQIKRVKEMVWIHDIYLLMVPYFLKKYDLNTNIGFSLHAPLASSDVFRTCPHRNEILKSLLCCDLIGLHTYEDCRNFLSACRKIFYILPKIQKGGFISLEQNGRTILINVKHIGINKQSIQ